MKMPMLMLMPLQRQLCAVPIHPQPSAFSHQPSSCLLQAAVANWHQCLLVEYYYDGACCFTAGTRLIFSFVHSQWGGEPWKWAQAISVERQAESQLELGEATETGFAEDASPGQPARKLSSLVTVAKAARCIYAFCVLSAVQYFLSYFNVNLCPYPGYYSYASRYVTKFDYRYEKIYA